MGCLQLCRIMPLYPTSPRSRCAARASFRLPYAVVVSEGRNRVATEASISIRSLRGAVSDQFCQPLSKAMILGMMLNFYQYISIYIYIYIYQDTSSNIQNIRMSIWIMMDHDTESSSENMINGTLRCQRGDHLGMANVGRLGSELENRREDPTIYMGYPWIFLDIHGYSSIYIGNL